MLFPINTHILKKIMTILKYILYKIYLPFTGDAFDLAQPQLNPKKWGFLDQSVIHDTAVVGLNLSSNFDHLLTASTSGGFDTKYRAMAPHSTLVLGTGSKPFLGYHYALEGAAQPVLVDVAKVVASKLKSALPYVRSTKIYR